MVFVTAWTACQTAPPSLSVFIYYFFLLIFFYFLLAVALVVVVVVVNPNIGILSRTVWRSEPDAEKGARRNGSGNSSGGGGHSHYSGECRLLAVSPDIGLF